MKDNTWLRWRTDIQDGGSQVVKMMRKKIRRKKTLVLGGSTITNGSLLFYLNLNIFMRMKKIKQTKPNLEIKPFTLLEVLLLLHSTECLSYSVKLQN